jgi:hypothetical protein
MNLTRFWRAFVLVVFWGNVAFAVEATMRGQWCDVVVFSCGGLAIGLTQTRAFDVRRWP